MHQDRLSLSTRWSTRIRCDLKAATLNQVANSVVESLLLSSSREWQSCFVDYEKTRKPENQPR